MSGGHGNRENGIEVRRDTDGEVDEVCLYVGGQCVAHLEQMSDVGWHLNLIAGPHQASIAIAAKNCRSHVAAVVDVETE